MRVVIHCRDRFGITLEILARVVKHRVNVSGMELGEEKLFLRLPGAAQHTFLALQEEVLGIDGVTGIEKVAFMPKEREHFELNVLMNSLERPTVSIDDAGRILFANPAAESAMALPDTYKLTKLSRYLGGVDLMPQIMKKHGKHFYQELRLGQSQFTVDIFPVDVQDWQDSRRIGAVLCFRPQNLISNRRHTLLASRPKSREAYVGGALSPIEKQMILALKEKKSIVVTGEESTGKETLIRHCLDKDFRRQQNVTYLHCDVADLEALESNLTDQARRKDRPEALATSILVLINIDKLSAKAAEQWKTVVAKALELTHDLFIATFNSGSVNCSSPILNATPSQSLVKLHVPALRERSKQEKKVLFDHFLRELAGSRLPDLTEDCMSVLDDYAWPGNCLELQASLHHGIGTVIGNRFTAELWYQAIEAGIFGHNSFDAVPTFAEMQSFFEQELLTKLHAVYPTTRKLAKRLGLSHTAVANKLRKYQISSH